jgi:membrane fusion protein (multidrug efflux system)/multidrug efflux system membrane fusion protein
MTSIGLKTGVDPDERTARYIAVIAPVKAVALAPRFAGELSAIHIEAGDRVEPGQLIAEIDARQLREALVVSEAALKSAQSALRQSKVDIADAQQVFTIEKHAVARGVSSKQQLNKAHFALDRAWAAESRARAAITETEARVEQSRNRLRDAQIRAPFTGVIAKLYQNVGTSVGPDAPVARLISTDRLHVRFAAPLSLSTRLTLGQQVTVEVADAPQPRQAVIRQIAPELDPASKMIFVEAELMVVEAGRSTLYPGAAAWVRIRDTDVKP